MVEIEPTPHVTIIEWYWVGDYGKVAHAFLWDIDGVSIERAFCGVGPAWIRVHGSDAQRCKNCLRELRKNRGLTKDTGGATLLMAP